MYLLSFLYLLVCCLDRYYCGQTCQSCSGVENRLECQHFTICSDDEVCYVQKYMTESAAILYDLGCAYEQVTRNLQKCVVRYNGDMLKRWFEFPKSPLMRPQGHSVGGIFGRSDEGRHISCTSCCNNTRTCNIDLQCDSNHHVSGANRPRECSEINGTHPDGIYNIYPDGSDLAIPVYCDMHTEHGKWTIIQRRYNGSLNFERDWETYKEGFGYPNGEYWLGNEVIHEITTHSRHELRIDMEDFEGHKKYAKYSIFSVGDEASEFDLTVQSYSGDAGDSFTLHDGMQFSTTDRDHDKHVDNCAKRFHGGWWYKTCHMCNLNGRYLSGTSPYGEGINWYTWRGFYYSLKSAKMMIRKLH